MLAISLTYFIPIFVLLALVLIMGTFALLARVQGGRYIRPIVTGMAKVPLLKRLLQKASRAAIERSNPELASAMKKLERSGALRDPQRAQAALSRLSAAERQAYMEAAGEMGAMPEAVNRQQRRRMEKMQQKGSRRR
jgi:hypothetical protein